MKNIYKKNIVVLMYTRTFYRIKCLFINILYYFRIKHFYKILLFNLKISIEHLGLYCFGENY